MTIAPYYTDGLVSLYHGNALQILPELVRGLLRVDAVITDPPYGSTKLEWDTWPRSWPNYVVSLTTVLWCFGSMRMFWENKDDFTGWKLAQDVVWEKHNGSSPATDRFRPVHELATMFYRGTWADLYKDVPTTNDSVARQVRRKKRPPQWGNIDEHHYVAEDGGPRQMRSVIYMRGCHGHAINETQKPEGIVAPLIHYSVPAGGIVLDPFAGSGTTLAVARRMGRKAIGIELRKEQCDLIVERLSQRELALGGA